MEIYLIRHSAVNLTPGICYGHSDVPLRDTWEKEADEIIQNIGHQNNPMVYSSPLLRCRRLAEKISSKVIIDDRLKELNFGIWELKPWDEIKGPEAERWMNDFVHVRCAGGESYIDLVIRVKAFLKELVAANSDTFTIVTHAGVIRFILALIQNIPLQKSFEIKVEHGQIIPLHFSPVILSKTLDFTDIF